MCKTPHFFQIGLTKRSKFFKAQPKKNQLTRNRPSPENEQENNLINPNFCFIFSLFFLFRFVIIPYSYTVNIGIWNKCNQFNCATFPQKLVWSELCSRRYRFCKTLFITLFSCIKKNSMCKWIQWLQVTYGIHCQIITTYYFTYFICSLIMFLPQLFFLQRY